MTNTPEPAYGQDEARGILGVNPYAEGSEEWHAWGEGYTRAVGTGGILEYPLAGEWAGDPGPQDVVNVVAMLMGLEPEDFFSDEFDSICEAYENGYAAYRAGWRV